MSNPLINRQLVQLCKLGVRSNYGIGVKRNLNINSIIFKQCQFRFNSSSSPSDDNKKPLFKYKTRKTKSEEEIKAEEEQKKYEEAINSDSKLRRWGAILGSFEFNKKATKYYIFLYACFLAYGIHYFKKLYNRELEKKAILNKRDTSNSNLTEWEQLRVRELAGDLIRTTDTNKLVAYHKLKQIWENEYNNLTTEEERENFPEFNPKPEDIKDLIDHKIDDSILPAKDLTEFYDNIAENYDKEIGMEETFSMMGSKRKKMMKSITGDVLEVACGTGRNIPYFDTAKVNSYTFLDTSSKMMEVTHDKFTEKFPHFKKVKFVVGKAEDLLDLSKGKDSKSDNNKQPIFKYDTIIETFGLCSHEDPVKALKNMKTLLKPGGRIILLEHGRGTYKFINEKLDARAHKHSESWGCRWNLDIGELVDKSGLEITDEKRYHFGTTWYIVAKLPGDVDKIEELGFFDKYFTLKKTNFDSSTGPNDSPIGGNVGSVANAAASNALPTDRK
ncbi:hypothetical protein B5S32_g4048 [[Candida] boidinii]|nr:hypothetical protein B5S32_g4048 [[Candida] boidinii]